MLELEHRVSQVFVRFDCFDEFVLNEHSESIYQVERMPLLIFIFNYFSGTVRKSLPNVTATTATTSVTPAKSVHRSLAFLNINGILYKSTKTKLQKTVNPSTATTEAAASSPDSQRTLIIRGERFTLDPTGKRLKKETTGSALKSRASLKRIDIGGLTYVMQSNSNTYVQTNSHKSRYHLNIAKQRSINMLSKKLVKSNVPCPIYRKLGKCAAFERSKCSKLHDPKQVNICQK